MSQETTSRRFQAAKKIDTLAQSVLHIMNEAQMKMANSVVKYCFNVTNEN